MTLKDFNKNYIYQTDKDKFNYTEVWEVIKPINKKYYGDCESYCLTLIHLKLVPKTAYLYYCKIENQGHCILIKDKEVIDCNTKEWIDLETYTKKYNMTSLRKYTKIEIWWKKITTKIFGYVPFIKNNN